MWFSVDSDPINITSHENVIETIKLLDKLSERKFREHATYLFIKQVKWW